MAIKCDAWRSEIDNSLHATDKAATEYDLEKLRVKLLASMSKSEEFLPRLIEHGDETVKLLSAYLKCHPRAKRPEQSSALDSTPGPIISQPQPAAEANGDVS